MSKSVTKGQVTAMTVITPITQGRLENLRAALKVIGAKTDGPITKINTIHYARWVIIDGGTRLLFTSNFDGTAEDYLRDFVEKASDGLDAIWGNCDGYPGAKPFDKFLAYVDEHEYTAELFYPAYPDATVKQIQKSLALRKAFHTVLDEMS